MSFRAERIQGLAGLDYSKTSPEELRGLFRKVLSNGMHGLCYSAYDEGQKPGDILTIEQVRRRMKVIAPYTKWIRSFSCIEGNELIPLVAQEHGLKSLVGAWLGRDQELNEKEIVGLISLAEKGLVDVAAVGNEVLYRKDLTVDQLLTYLKRVKEALPGIPVGYVDAYYEFRDHPEIVAACDVILANCYPYWEGCHIDYSLVYMKQMYQQAVDAAGGKKVIITETGWPSQGSSLQGAQPSTENFLKYFINAQKWSAEENIEMFYFTSVDESWKVSSEGDVGACWGLWNTNENLKF